MDSGVFHVEVMHEFRIYNYDFFMNSGELLRLHKEIHMINTIKAMNSELKS